MSLFPLLSRNLGCTHNHPLHVLDEAMDISDLLSPSLYSGFLVRPRSRTHLVSPGQSDVSCDKDRFKIMVNVNHFKPNEIDVKTMDNYIVVHGKHEEMNDEHGFVSREFTRRYLLPEGTEPETVTSSFSPNGVLTIEAPKKATEPLRNERIVPITIEQPVAVEGQ